MLSRQSELHRGFLHAAWRAEDEREKHEERWRFDRTIARRRVGDFIAAS